MSGKFLKIKNIFNMHPSLHTPLSLAAGLVVGVTGAILFQQSMPPEKGSVEEKVMNLENELKRAKNQIAALDAADPDGRRRPGRTLKDGARSIAEDIRDGKAVTPDDILRATQPLLRDLNPLFSRMRLREQERRIDTMTGELARKYALNSIQQEALKRWFEQKATEEGERYDALISQDGTRLVDLITASRDVRPDEGLDAFMETTLQGEKLASFKNDRMLEKVAKVQEEADMKVARLDEIVTLDDAQRGEVFGVMARGSAYFDPTMGFEGMGTEKAALTTGQSKQDAMLAVLRPEQRAAYQEQREQKRTEARKDLESIGLTLPEDWDALEELDF